jgi:hypothetical protein
MSLLQIQTELKAPKGQFNTFGHYAYRSTEDILKAVKPLLTKYGDNLNLSDEPIMMGDWHYIKATATFTDKEGKETVVHAYAREAVQKKGMDDSQVTGTASSYARKYALNGLFLIDDTKDADTDEYRNQNNRPQRRPAAKRQVTKPKENPEASQQLAKGLEMLASMMNSTPDKIKASLIEQYHNEAAYKRDPTATLLNATRVMYHQLQKDNA